MNRFRVYGDDGKVNVEFKTLKAAIAYGKILTEQGMEDWIVEAWCALEGKYK